LIHFYKRSENPRKLHRMLLRRIGRIGLQSKLASKRNPVSLPLVRCVSNHRVIGTFGDNTQILPEDKVFVETSPNEEDENKPLVILFGWAGATPKNLSKYGSVYSDLGCPTVEYILPTRFIFRHTEQVFEAVDDLLDVVQRSGRKTIVHCLSDTASMTFQGLSVAADLRGDPFNPSAIVWDSCPGPYPIVTLPRTVVLTAINWLARMRDGMNLRQAITSSAVDFRDLGWKNFIRRYRYGLDSKISTMDETWCGYWARDHPLDVPQLYIYSKSDFYCPWSNIETNVLPARRKIVKDLTVLKFHKSPHVGHLRANGETYRQHIKQLVEKVNNNTK